MKEKEKTSNSISWQSKADWRNPNWKYTKAAATDISKTIARIKREMKELQEKAPDRVVHLKRAVK